MPPSIGGSYGWSSAGRYHHARTQLHRFLGLGGGFTAQVTTYSYAAGMTLMPHILGTNEVLLGRGDGLGGDPRAREADALLRRAAAEERAGHLGRRRRGTNTCRR